MDVYQNNKEKLMNNKQLIKLANAYRQSTEKRAFLGGLARLVSILSKSKAGLKLIPRATQMSKEAPKAFKLLTNKNVGQMLKRPTMPGMKPPTMPPPLPSRFAGRMPPRMSVPPPPPPLPRLPSGMRPPPLPRPPRPRNSYVTNQMFGGRPGSSI